MQLSRMHDIAGCRLIFEDIPQLVAFQKEFRSSRFNHVRRFKDADNDPYDYLKSPKQSGYRGRHDVYQYRAYAPAGAPWNGLHIEIQYRTKVQHAWATAVEIAGSITENKPKFDQGDERYLDFFRVTSEILARAFENSNGCVKHASDKDLLDRFYLLESDIHLLRHLSNINKVNSEFQFRRNVILIFNEMSGELEAESYTDASDAVDRYFEIEKNNAKDIDVVLVRADSSDSIKYAFRNYFSDSEDFVHLVNQGLLALSSTH